MKQLKLISADYQTLYLDDITVGIDPKFRDSVETLTELNLGGRTVGWYGPLRQSSISPTRCSQRAITILMGSKAYNITLGDFEHCCQQQELDIKHLAFLCELRMEVILKLPVGSLDIYRQGPNIDYTSKSIKTLFNGLTNYATLLKAHIRTTLNQQSPYEFLKTYLLLAHGDNLFTELSWRGTKLDDLVIQSGMKRCVISPTKSHLFPFSPEASFYRFARYRNYKNVTHVLVTAESAEELILAEKMLLGLDFPRMFASHANLAHPHKDTIYYLCEKGDSLEQWVEGKRITVKEMYDVAVSHNLLEGLLGASASD